MYLIEMMSVIAQKTSESTPSTLSRLMAVGWSPEKHSRTA
jgi:hypothetical protein